MKCLAFVFVAILAAGAAFAQQHPAAAYAASGPTVVNGSSNLPVERIGRNDLVGISVYDSPELTRAFRVDPDGMLRLPMLKQPIQAAGLYPAELESAIRTALTSEQVFVDPVVSVSIAEYRSRPISVSGAVKSPVSFQAAGTVTLLDAISQAGGLTEDAGSEILVSRPQVGADGNSTSLVQRIPVRGLLDGEDASLNMSLKGGEEIRIPLAGRFYVVGQVKRPGEFLIRSGAESSVLKALALSEGLDHYSGNIAYIYRIEAGSKGKNEIPIELKKIMTRKAPDVPLLANDVFYIPQASGRKAAVATLGTAVMIGAGLGTTLLYLYH